MGTKKKNGTRTVRSLVIKKLEKVSKLIFRNYYKQITDLVGNSHGIYALYDDNDLYYVGKSTDLRKRVKQHLKDRHFASWTHFSLYLVRKADHVGEIESLLIRIANPRGNTKKYRTDRGSSLLKQLKTTIRDKQREEFIQMFGERATRKEGVKRSADGEKSLVGLFQHKKDLYRTYKGKEYRAQLSPKGIIRYAGKTYDTPTAAAKAIVKRASVNGWWFWYVKNMDGEWVKLADYWRNR